MDLVGIVILNWKALLDTKNCINSIIETQSGYEYKIYLVDNYSQDGSYEKIIETYLHIDNITFIQTGSNFGYSKGNNYGIRAAINDGCGYICILNNDVIVFKNTIVPLINLLEQNKTIGIAGGKVYFSDKKNLIWSAGGFFDKLNASSKGIGYKSVDKGQYNIAKEVDFIPGAIFVISAKLLIEVGLLPECYFLGGEEVDLSFNVKKLGYKIYYNSESKCLHKVGYSGNTSIKYIYNRFRNRLLLIRRNYSLKLIILAYIYYFGRNVVLTGMWALFNKQKRRTVRSAIFAFVDHFRCMGITLEHLEAFDSKYD